MENQATNSSRVVEFRKRIKIGLVEGFGHKCCLCGLIEEPYMYDFHHINPEEKQFGLSNSNTRSKEKSAEEAKKCVMLCANCHRKVENTKNKIDYHFVSNFNERTFYDTVNELNGYVTQTAKENRQKMLQEIKEKEQAFYPSREELKNLIRNQSFTSIGLKYGVSDNAIKKWCDKNSLPRTKREINSYSNEDWALI